VDPGAGRWGLGLTERCRGATGLQAITVFGDQGLLVERQQVVDGLAFHHRAGALGALGWRCPRPRHSRQQQPHERARRRTIRRPRCRCYAPALGHYGCAVCTFAALLKPGLTSCIRDPLFRPTRHVGPIDVISHCALCSPLLGAEKSPSLRLKPSPGARGERRYLPQGMKDKESHARIAEPPPRRSEMVKSPTPEACAGTPWSRGADSALCQFPEMYKARSKTNCLTLMPLPRLKPKSCRCRAPWLRIVEEPARKGMISLGCIHKILCPRRTLWCHPPGHAIPPPLAGRRTVFDQ